MKKLAPAALLACLALSLSACADGGASAESSSPDAASSAAAAPTSSAAAEPAETSSAAPAESSAAAEGGLAAEVEQALAGYDNVTGVESPEEGRVHISTDLVDPRTDDSPEAAQAVEICEAAVGVDGVTYVALTEADGTNWVLYGHPAVPEGECTEY